MIRGIVTGDREAVVRLTVVGFGGRQKAIDAVIDTGFDGFLSLPRSVIEAYTSLGDRRWAILADGSESVFDVYRGTVLWDRQRRKISINEADSVPLLGMSLLANFVLEVEAWSGGRVTIRRPR